MPADIKAKLDYQFHQTLKIKRQPDNYERNIALTRMIVENNCPMSMVESKSFRNFVKLICPNYCFLGRSRIASEFIPMISHSIQESFRSSLTGECRLSLEIDHWKDYMKRDLLGVIVTKQDGSRYLCGLVDVSGQGHFATVTVEELKMILEINGINPKHINSIMSDSASACKKARENFILIPDCQHVIEHRCLAHLVNLIGNLFNKHSSISPAIEWANYIVKKVSNNPKILAFMNESDCPRLRKSTPIRWYSTVNMICSMIDSRQTLLSATKKKDPNMTPKLIRMIEDEEKWSTISQSSIIYQMIAKCLGICERKTSSLGEGFKAILELGHSLFELDFTKHMNLLAMKSYLTYINVDYLGIHEFGLLVSAYIFDRKYKMDYIRDDATELAMKTILRIALSHKTAFIRAQQLIVEMNEFFEQKYQFSRHPVTNEKAYSWWKKLDDSGDLKKCALRLANLKSSSANIERTFSTLRLIQNAKSANLSIERLNEIGRIRIDRDDGLDEVIETLQSFEIDSYEETTNNSHNIRDDSRADSRVDSGDESDFRNDTEIEEEIDELTEEVGILSQKFRQYFDFSIINEYEEENLDDRAQSITDQDIEALLSQERQKRINRDSR